ncbi:hypothetical protein [Limnohabitans radicicola]|nr:hypothetical protein [Limnohabitans radicicola]
MAYRADKRHLSQLVNVFFLQPDHEIEPGGQDRMVNGAACFHVLTFGLVHQMRECIGFHTIMAVEGISIMTDTNTASVAFSLAGSRTTSKHFRLCNWCEKKKLPESGVEMGKGLWKCGHCWTRQASRPAKSI